MGLRTKLQALRKEPLWKGDIEGLGAVSIYPLTPASKGALVRYMVQPHEGAYTDEETEKMLNLQVGMIYYTLLPGEADLEWDDIASMDLDHGPGKALLEQVNLVLGQSNADFRDCKQQ